MDEFEVFINLRDSAGAPCEEVRRLAAGKLAEVETRLREIVELRDELQLVLKEWDVRLAHRAPGQRARPRTYQRK